MATSIHLHMGIIGDGPFGCILMVTFIASYSLKMINGQLYRKPGEKLDINHSKSYTTEA